MKKILVLTAVFAAMFLMVSCGSDSGSGNADCYTQQGNDCGGKTVKTCTEGDDSWYEVDGKKFMCDKNAGCDQATIELTKYCDSLGDSGSEGGDSGSEGGDSGSEGGDSGSEGDDTNSFECDMPGDYTCKNGDSYVCQLLPTGDMIWSFNEECADGCDAETGACNAILRDCSESHHELCTDEETGLMWSKKSGEKHWTEANQYCEDLEELGFDDWRLPTIDELRTLVLECEGTVTGGTCSISEEGNALDEESWTDDCFCEESSMGIYTKFGTDDWYVFLWSSSPVSGYSEDNAHYWALETAQARISATNNEDSMTEARCIRNAE